MYTHNPSRGPRNSYRKPALSGLAITVGVIFAVTSLTSCDSLPAPRSPGARAFVIAELASIAAGGEYSYSVLDFSDTRETSRSIEASGSQFESLTANIGFEIGRRINGNDAPPDGHFVGSTEHLRLMGAGTVRLETPSTILGMHVVLTHEQALLHRWMEAGTEAQLLVTGIDRRGTQTGTVKTSPAAATPGSTRVANEWTWVDLSELGEVAELRMTFESPLTELPVLLVDNFTISGDFVPDPDYFTIALLPATGAHVESAPEILDSQLDYLADTRATGEPIVFVSHLGGIVSNGAEEAEWEVVDEAMETLDGAVTYGIVPGLSDMEDPVYPETGSPYFLDYFPEERNRQRGGRSGYSEDGYSSFHIVETPVGDFLSIHLMVDAPPPTIEWAQRLLYEHRDLPTMMTTSVYLEVNGEMVRRHAAPALMSLDESWEGVSAQELWEQVIWPNSQVFLVACGDGLSENLQISWNSAELPVVELLSGYQPGPDGEEGYLRLLRFYPDRNELRVVTYSPWLDTYEQDADSFFRLPIDISGRLGLE